jgi:hypothetical protein
VNQISVHPICHFSSGPDWRPELVSEAGLAVRYAQALFIQEKSEA